MFFLKNLTRMSSSENKLTKNILQSHRHVLLVNNGQLLSCFLFPSSWSWPVIDNISCISMLGNCSWKSESECYSSSSSAMVVGLHRVQETSSPAGSIFQSFHPPPTLKPNDIYLHFPSLNAKQAFATWQKITSSHIYNTGKFLQSQNPRRLF